MVNRLAEFNHWLDEIAIYVSSKGAIATKEEKARCVGFVKTIKSSVSELFCRKCHNYIPKQEYSDHIGICIGIPDMLIKEENQKLYEEKVNNTPFFPFEKYLMRRIRIASPMPQEIIINLEKLAGLEAILLMMTSMMNLMQIE